MLNKPLVLYPGRFMPFHKSHKETYDNLVKKFGKDSVYIVTSNKVELPNSPFNFEEKKKIITTMFKDIPTDHVIQVKNPYQAVEVLSQYPETTPVIFAVGAKDAERLATRGFFQNYKDGMEMKSNKEKGYIFIAPPNSGMSGSKVREVFNSDDNEAKEKLFVDLYGSMNKPIFKLLISKIVKEELVKCEECGLMMKQIMETHTYHKHGMLLKEYKQKYPNSPLISETLKNTGDKNPFYGKQHDKKTFNNICEKIENIWKNQPERFMNVGISASKRMSGENNIAKREDVKEKISSGVKKSYNGTGLRELRSEQQIEIRNSREFQEKMYNEGIWIHPDRKTEFQKYRMKVVSLTEQTFKKYYNEIPNAEKRSFDYHLDHKYSIKEAFENNVSVEVVSHYKNLEVISREMNESKHYKSSITLNELLLASNYFYSPNSELLLCGGAYGHLSHFHDVKTNTFADLKEFIETVLQGKMEYAHIKTDGMNLLFSFIDGQLRGARNGGDLKNFGKDSLTIKTMSDKFKGRGGVQTAYVAAMRDLQQAIGRLPKEQIDKIFKNGQNWMSVEVIHPEAKNVIPYNTHELRFHGIKTYDESGKVIGEDPSSARKLADMIKDIKQNKQDTYEIKPLEVAVIPPAPDFKAQRAYFLNKANALQKEYKLKDSDTIASAFETEFTNIIKNHAKHFRYSVPSNVMKGLVERWGLGNKSFKASDISKIDNEKFRDWALEFDKTEADKIAKEVANKFEYLTLEVGAVALKNLSTFMVFNPSKAVQEIKKDLDNVIKQIQNSKNPELIDKLKYELGRLSAIGGINAIAPEEGITAFFHGQFIKVTGAFPAINTIMNLRHKL